MSKVLQREIEEAFAEEEYSKESEIVKFSEEEHWDDYANWRKENENNGSEAQ